MLVLNVPLYLQMLNLLWTFSLRVYHILSLFLSDSQELIYICLNTSNLTWPIISYAYTWNCSLYFQCFNTHVQGGRLVLGNLSCIASILSISYHLYLTWNEYHFSLIRCFELNFGLLKLFLSNWRLFNIYIVLSLIQYSFINLE